MNIRTFMAAMPLLALFAGPTIAQVLAPLPTQGPAPLLFVRVSGPEGMKANFYTGEPTSRQAAAPAVIGVRPGYIYRIKLSNLPGRPNLNLYPTLEVRGSLRLLPSLHPQDFPAPVIFTPSDLEQAAAGSMITKVIYLEHPDRAAPTATTPAEPIETDVGAECDALQQSFDLGRPVLIVRIGERAINEEEMLRSAILGTLMPPGEKYLAPARMKPFLPYSGWQFVDPHSGPRAAEEECVRDGGDRGVRVGLDPNGKLVGLDAEDTVAEYTDAQGRKHVSISNRVCLCTPRYAVLRCVLPLGRFDTVLSPGGLRDVAAQQLVRARQPSLVTEQFDQMNSFVGRKKPSGTQLTTGPGILKHLDILNAEQIDLGLAAAIGGKGPRTLSELERIRLAKQMEFALDVISQKRPSGVEQVAGPAVVGRVEGGPIVIKAIAEIRDYTCICNEEARLPDKPLTLCKWADRQSAQPGDIVTFTLRYTNQGGRPMTDIAVSDSLTTRLEFVPGSSQSDRNSVFTLQDNKAGSSILRWEITGTLQPGASGIVRFKAKVR